MKNNSLSPLFLQSTLGPFVGLGSVGSSVPLEIYNPNKTAMLVDQLRFSLVQKDSSRYLELTSALTGLGIEVLLGAIPLTKQTVTLGALAPRYSALNENFGGSDAPYNDMGLVWHLPKPLYVPPLVQLSVHVKRQSAFPGDTGSVDIQALNVSVVGRSLPADFPVPGSIDIPWVTETKCITTAPSFVSGDSDLVNSNNVPYQVTQFVGINSLLVSIESDNIFAPPTPAELTVQMSLSNGTMLIRDQIPFFVAFPSDRGILPVSALLQPGAFVRLELESSVPVGGEAFDGCGFTAVAMHGYRSIQTPGTLG